MNYLIDESTPKLSKSRYKNNDISHGQAHEFKTGNKVKIIHKTVQAWLTEAIYNGTEDDPFSGNKPIYIQHQILWKLAQKIEWATQLKVRGQYGSTPMQVTNYGLGGLCEVHIDPHGYIEGKFFENRGRYPI